MRGLRDTYGRRNIVNFAKSYTIFPIALTAVLVQDIGHATLLIADDLPLQY
jgi:hypothetical protein